MNNSILVLEGGAMRSLYTSGVLDVLMENDIKFDSVIGVSAGALVGSNFISEQKGRTADINISYCDDPRYIGIKAIKNNRGLVGFDYLFGEISDQKNPFDENTFLNSDRKFIIGATNCLTGKTEYFEEKSKIYKDILQASSSMPLVSKEVYINEKPYLDGAIDCNIPIDWALENSYKKIVVVLTREKGYIKKEVSPIMKKVYNKVYGKKYPELINCIYDRPNKYNQTYKKIEQLENDNKIFVFQPDGPVNVSRLERNKEKLRQLYNDGINSAKSRLEELKKYMEF